jgi:hypothetical protein
MTVVALDGMPLAYHDPGRRTEELRHVLLAPAGRAEVIVEGPKPGRTTSLRTLCVNTGADGDRRHGREHPPRSILQVNDSSSPCPSLFS